MHRARVLAGVILLACAVHASAQSAVSIRFDEGLVTLSARNAPLDAILAEWARAGGSRIVNVEGVGGPPLTLELTKVRERDALAILLRSVSGYLLASRSEPAAGRSSIDRIVILATSSPVRAAPAVVSPPPPEPAAGASAPRNLQDLRDLIPDLRDRIPAIGSLPSNPYSSAELQELQELREAAAREAAARRAATDGPQEVEPPAPPGGRSALPASPFGNMPTAARPGEILPAPPQDAPPNR